jgi:thiamine biosynthesis lipoprotein
MTTDTITVPVGAPCFELTFPVMGSKAHLVVVQGEPASLDDARDRLQDLHQRWTRFEPDSEVSRINAHAGQPVAVSAETVVLVGMSVEAWRRTHGRFDPSVLPALISAGYDRDFAAITTTTVAAVPKPVPQPTGCADVVVDAAAGTVCIPEGSALDFGGIAKGLAADMVLADLLDAGALGACVNVGGDLRVHGVAPRRGGWVVGVDDPRGEGLLGCIRTHSAAVATSSRAKRAWGPAAHHLIDPRTCRPASTGVESVTVVRTGEDSGAWFAEALAKAAFLAGPHDGPAVLAEYGATGLFVRDDGSHVAAPGWEALMA